MFLKNRKIIFKMKISKVTDYAALTVLSFLEFVLNQLLLKSYIPFAREV